MPQLHRPRIYLASPVFRAMLHNTSVAEPLRSLMSNLFHRLDSVATVMESSDRFPQASTIEAAVKQGNINFVGCHLSHPISEACLKTASLKAVCTATAGYNHIHLPAGDVLVTHTPSVLHQAVADFTLTLILSSLRKIPTLNSKVWDGEWTPDKKWDMDAFLSPSLSSLTLGIIGMGEIASALVSKLVPWNMRILYHSRTRKPELEKQHLNLVYCPDPELIFQDADIVSLHTPLTPETHGLAGRRCLEKMKPGSLLVNTSRGDIVDFKALLSLLESGSISIHLAFDVFDPEPLPEMMLKRFTEIRKAHPELSLIFLPHVASADADTRARMTAMMIQDLITLATALSWDDLTPIHLIPEQKIFMKQRDPGAVRLFRNRV